jgi:hypothetical protein
MPCRQIADVRFSVAATGTVESRTAGGQVAVTTAIGMLAGLGFRG